MKLKKALIKADDGNKSGGTVGKISIIPCDLNDLQSVQHCARTFLKMESKLDILINNAGIMAVPTRQATKQGYLEQQVGICHVGHFYLTELLLPALENAGTNDSPSRIVCLSSSAHRFHQMEDCLKDSKLDTIPYDPWVAYGNAKVANLLHAKALHDKFAKEKTKNILAYSVMPGGINTGLQQHVTLWTSIKFAVVSPFFFKTTSQGSATTLLCATAPPVDTSTDILRSGEYHDNCKVNPDALQKVLTEIGTDAPERLYNITKQILKDLGY